MFVFWGSTVMQVTDILLGTPETCVHVLAALVISLLTHKPPLVAPANTLVALPGAKINARVLPPTLYGPRSTH